MEGPQQIASTKMFGGYNKRYKFQSRALGCETTFTIFFPPAASEKKVPIIYWLSGLTCTDENVFIKSGVQRPAADQGIAIIGMDTSPRGLNVEGESDSWDFGVGAGFYLNATQGKWKNWQMYDYVTKELPELLKANFSELDTSRASIFGHSMGGHGALTLYLKNPGAYKSASAFAPISNPSAVPWGKKAFSNYLGDDKSAWEAYDATCLVKNYQGPKSVEILIDQGEADGFLKEQLQPENFKKAAEAAGVPVNLRIQSGYDHSYYFISTFIEDHVMHHAKALHS
ncbi:S-formylglutathione hydrolase [Marchantia polymorpha subsp. ruderalis]|uniref:S-formylglutathione hydrolase n=2 Tax=Marchantia polymorpha TaxID=3197 RepID=A0AAF6BD28_MARPO|nr:hypothetical protein MARPO_0020s0136 [Marchantia polymorpha]BBN09912.1 hypothetical protein Mp_4g23730 [Marchantia polymorpha subsp. ruderalis]|eukprot:PTQ44489.1 hypothetical protein MARPO_0020s0136 [Marchantia polymorpha]